MLDSTIWRASGLDFVVGLAGSLADYELLSGISATWRGCLLGRIFFARLHAFAINACSRRERKCASNQRGSILVRGAYLTDEAKLKLGGFGGIRDELGARQIMASATSKVFHPSKDALANSTIVNPSNSNLALHSSPRRM